MLEDVSPTLVALLVKGGAHHLDMRYVFNIFTDQINQYINSPCIFLINCKRQVMRIKKIVSFKLPPGRTSMSLLQPISKFMMMFGRLMSEILEHIRR